MRIFTALFFAAVYQVAAQGPEVPHKMQFADLTLSIRDDARREIQKDVNALTQSPKHFNIKVERARTYFPIIEKVFQEENVPDDMKYLVLQESALIPDAVSSSNAVGFWQFKDFTAVEMGLRVDRSIDERMNIVSSSRAAARYLKKNNMYFNNWLYALQAYQMGAGGALKVVKKNQHGVSRMEITSDTYWYVKKFLAHKIAFESAVKGKAQREVLTYPNSDGKSLKQLAKEVQVDEEELLAFNKWTKSGSIPSDRSYAVIIPLPENKSNIDLPVIAQAKKEKDSDKKISADVSVTKKINDLVAIQALKGETAITLAQRAGIDLSKFLKWNDLKYGTDQVVADEYYFLSKKRIRAIDNFHKVQPGEDLWSVSQRYGVRMKRLRKYNRLSPGETVAPGTMLYLASKRPKSAPASKAVENPVVVDSEETFSWAATPEANSAPVTELVSAPRDTVITETVGAEPVAQETVAEFTVQESAISETTVAEIETQPTDAVQTVQNTVIVEEAPVEEIATQEDKTEPLVNKGSHTVAAGETLYGISRLYNVSVMDLVNWNGLDLKDGIKPGQLLQLSGNQTFTDPVKDEVASSMPLQETLHEVKSSDTLYSIARQYGVTIKELMDWNSKKDFSLAVGEKLKIHQQR
jgi:membrane-bound lytic murein transglycosylase D